MSLTPGPVLYSLGIALVAAMAVAGLQTVRLSNAKADHEKHLAADAKAYADAQIQARQNEQAAGARQAQLEAQYLKDQQNAKAEYDRVVSALRAGELKLRERWRCPVSVPRIAGAPSEPDASPDDGAESAGRIIRAAAECDAQVKGLQGIVVSDRQLIEVK